MSKNIRKRRERLFEQANGKCYYCSIDTVLPPRGMSRIEQREDYATLDHLRTKLDKNRQEPNSTNEIRTVLACWKCNNLRGQISQLLCRDFTVKIKEEVYRPLKVDKELS